MPGPFLPPRLIFDPNAFNPANPQMWEEEVADHGRRQDTVTHGESLCTLRGYVLNREWVLPALAYWLGYSWTDYTNPSAPKLRRKLPAPHPESTQLFANRVQVMGWKYKRKINLPALPDAFGRRQPFAEYEKYYFEVDFGMVDYDVLPDDWIRLWGVPQPITEFERFTTILPEDETEIMTVDGGNYIYNDGANPANSVVLNGPMMRRWIERTELLVTVKNVPYDFLFDPFNIPRKLMGAKGKVNRYPFLDFNPQTILLKSWHPIRYPQPVATQTWTVLQFGIDIQFRFSYQEPLKAVPTEELAGWNLVPKISPRWKDGWYGIQTDTASGSRPLYSRIRMDSLMTHWSVNDLDEL